MTHRPASGSGVLALLGPVVAAAALGADPAPKEAPPAGLDVAVRRYLEAPDDAARAALASELAPFDLLPARALADAIRRVRSYPARAGYSVRTVRFKNQDVRVHVATPPEYVPARAWPLIVSYQGVSTDGIDGVSIFAGAPDFLAARRAHLADGLRQQGIDPARVKLAPVYDAKGYLVVSPDLPADHATRPGYPASETQNLFFQLMLRDVFRAYHVDTDRVFVAGLSQGGCWAWDDATFRGDWLAGSLPVAGYSPDGPGEPCLTNLVNCPLYVMHGTRDADTPVEVSRRPVAELRRLKYDVTYREFDGGHEWPTREGPALLAWMGSKKRNPFPRQVNLMNGWWQRCPGRFYWLDLKLADGVPAIAARIEGNRIELTTRRALECDLLLNETLVDFAREVTVQVNGQEAWTGRVAGSARLALDSYLERGDAAALYNARVPLKLPR